MSEESVKTCDVCKERQISANGWIRYKDPLDGDFLVLRKKSRSSLSFRDACGHSCALKAFNSWLVAVHVNAPVEGKKDETLDR